MKRVIIITLLILSIPSACCAQDAWYEARESSAVHYTTSNNRHIRAAHQTREALSKIHNNIAIDTDVMALMNKVPSSKSSSPSIQAVAGVRSSPPPNKAAQLFF